MSADVVSTDAAIEHELRIVERVLVPQLLVLELRLGGGAHLDAADGGTELQLG